MSGNEGIKIIGLGEALKQSWLDLITVGTGIIHHDNTIPGKIRFKHISLEVDPLTAALKKTFCHEKADTKMPANSCRDE